VKNQFNFFQKHIYEQICQKVEGLLEDVQGGMDLKDGLHLVAELDEDCCPVIQVCACPSNFVGFDNEPDEIVKSVRLRSIFLRLLDPEFDVPYRLDMAKHLREIADEIERVKQKT
jgi:hypothetical protein